MTYILKNVIINFNYYFIVFIGICILHLCVCKKTLQPCRYISILLYDVRVPEHIV